MSSSGAHAGSSAGEAIRKGVGLVHGAGEALRGNINAAVDDIGGDRQGVAKNEAIASRGIDEMEHGHYHGTGAGVTPVDTAREQQNRAVQGEVPHNTHTHTHGGPTYTGPTHTGPTHTEPLAHPEYPRETNEFGTRR